MLPTVRTMHAWLLTLLLLAGTTPLSRACTDCHAPAPTTGAETADGHGCCGVPDAAQPTDGQDDTPQPPLEDCDCPLGCCPAATAKAMSGPASVLSRVQPADRWDIPASRPRAGPAAEGPRRPPRL